MISVHNEVVSELTELVMLRFFHSVQPPFRRAYFEHKHSAFEISMIHSGHGLYQLKDRVYEFQPGDVFLFSTNEVHCITEIRDNEKLDIMNLQFEPRFIWMPGNEQFDHRYLDIFFHRNASASHQLRSDDPRADVIRTLLGEIETEFASQKESYDLMVKNKLLTLLVHVRRNYGEFFDHHPSRKEMPHIQQLDAVMKYIDDHLGGELTLEGLAAEAHMSKSYFSSLFRELNGLSPWEYILSKRITRAAQLLASTDRTVLDIAAACGFNSTANFNYAFRKLTQTSPSEYRTKAQKGRKE